MQRPIYLAMVLFLTSVPVGLLAGEKPATVPRMLVPWNASPYTSLALQKPEGALPQGRAFTSAKATVNDEIVQRADGQQPLADSGETTEASGLKLRLWLHESLLDLGQPVEVTINGKPVTTFTPTLDTATMAKSLLAFDDPECIYPDKVDVVVP